MAKAAPKTNVSRIKVGARFTASDGESYKKTSELTYDDSYGMERYIDPLFDRKINAPLDTRGGVDTSARIVAAPEPKPATAKAAKPKPAKGAKAAKKKR